MSRVFDGTENQSLRLASALDNAASFTVSLWAKWDGTEPGTNQYLFSIGDNGGSVFFGLRLNNGAPPQWEAVHYDGTTAGVATYGIDAAANSWVHLAAEFGSTSSRRIVVSGTATENTTAVTGSMAAVDSTMIGALATDANGTLVFNGKIAEVGVWGFSFAGSAARYSTLGTASPMLLLPASLLSYVPCLMPQGWAAGGSDDEPDWIIASDWVENGTVGSDSDHPPVYYPSGSPFPWGYATSAVAAPSLRLLPLLGVGV